MDWTACPRKPCFQARKAIWLCSALPRTFSYGGKGYKTLHCTWDWGFLPAGHLLQGKEWKETTVALAKSVSFVNYFTAKINFEKAPLWNLFIYSLRWGGMFLQSSLHSMLQVRWSPVQPCLGGSSRVVLSNKMAVRARPWHKAGSPERLETQRFGWRGSAGSWQQMLRSDQYLGGPKREQTEKRANNFGSSE